MPSPAQQKQRFYQDMDQLAFFKDASQKGDIFLYHTGDNPAFLLSHPDYVEYALATHEENFAHQEHPYQLLQPILTANGRFLLRLKQDDDQGRQNFLNLMALTQQHSQNLLDFIQTHHTSPFEITQPFKEHILRFIVDALFGIDTTQGLENFVYGTSLVELSVSNQMSFNPQESLTELVGRPFAAAQSIQTHFSATIAHFHLGNIDEDGCYHLNDQPIPANKIHGAITRTLLNGYNALAGTLAWACYLLAQHPTHRQTLQQEIDTTLGPTPPTPHHIPQLRFTKMVLAETMRLYPPAWMLGRHAINADTIGNQEIPPQATVSVCPYTTHRHPDFWSHPEQFHPHHFSPEENAGRHHYAWFPFGGGQRLCPGSHVSLPILQTFLAQLIQHFDWHTLPYHPTRPTGRISLRPEPGITLQFLARNQ
ncbi:MAG TPA: cytochrome P450 [Anaerolineae bacterium]|nr:cytochrome P450 [Anaerolineae bacterium]